MNGREARALRRAVRQEAERLMASRALADVAIERKRQDDLWGEQNCPLGTGPTLEFVTMRDEMKRQCDLAAENGKLTWRHILAEEFTELLAESEPARVREEAIQVAAVAVAIAEYVDRLWRGEVTAA